MCLLAQPASIAALAFFNSVATFQTVKAQGGRLNMLPSLLHCHVLKLPTLKNIMQG